MKKQRIFALLLATIMLFSSMSVSVFAEKTPDSSSASFAVAAPGRTTLKVGKSTAVSATINWISVPNASGYAVYRATSKSGKYTKLGKVTSLSYTDNTVTVAKTYYYKVKAYTKTSATTLYGSYSNTVSVSPSLGTLANFYIVMNPTQLILSWDKVAYASGYAVYRSSSPTGTFKRVGLTKSAQYTDTGLKSETKYYYKLRAYRSISGKKYYGNYTKAFTFATTSSSRKKPALSFATSTQTDKKCVSIAFALKNYGSKTLTVKTGATYKLPGVSKRTRTNMKLIDYNQLINYNNVSYINSQTLKSGKDNIFVYVLNDITNPTVYNSNGVMYIPIVYNGISYTLELGSSYYLIY